MNEDKVCNFCESPATLRCTYCPDVGFYCSVLCQKKDWPNYKLVCFLSVLVRSYKNFCLINNGINHNNDEIKLQFLIDANILLKIIYKKRFILSLDKTNFEEFPFQYVKAFKELEEIEVNPNILGVMKYYVFNVFSLNLQVNHSIIYENQQELFEILKSNIDSILKLNILRFTEEQKLIVHKIQNSSIYSMTPILGADFERKAYTAITQTPNGTLADKLIALGQQYGYTKEDIERRLKSISATR